VSLNTILAQVRSYVATAVGATVPVHDGIRWAASESDFRALFRDSVNGRLHGWQVSWGGAEEEVDGLLNLNLRTHTVIIQGIYAVDDPAVGTSMTSEVAFRGVVESVCTQLRGNFTIAGEAMNATPPEVAAFEPRIIRGVLCHFSEVRFEAIERLSYA